MLWRCWLGDRKGIRPVKNWVVGCWHGYLSGARCRLAYGPADATATCFMARVCWTWDINALTFTQWRCSCFSKIQIGFTFLVPAHLGSPGQRAVKRVCVCVSVFRPQSLSALPWPRGCCFGPGLISALPSFHCLGSCTLSPTCASKKMPWLHHWCLCIFIMCITLHVWNYDNNYYSVCVILVAVEVQTVITIPQHFDLQSLLG